MFMHMCACRFRGRCAVSFPIAVHIVYNVEPRAHGLANQLALVIPCFYSALITGGLPHLLAFMLVLGL